MGKIVPFDRDCQLICDDAATWLATMDAESVDLVVSSPPYNIGKSYERRTAISDYLNRQLPVIDQLVRVLKPTGSVCWQVGNYVDRGEVFPLDIFYYNLFKERGLQLRNRLVWHFGHGLHASKRFSGRYETILWFSRSNDYIFNLDDVRVPSKYPGKRYFKGDKVGELSGSPKGKNPSDFWGDLTDEWNSGVLEIPNVKANHPEKTSHPCQFPVELAERCVLALTDSGGLVLDPFGGVGSTAIAAIKNGRRAISIDRDPEFTAMAAQRVGSFHRGELRLRPLGKPVHVPTGDRVSSVPPEWRKVAGSVY